MLLTVLTIIVILSSVIIGYFTCAFNYWKRKGVPYIQPKFPFGTIENPLNRKYSFGFRLQRQYKELKSQGHKHGGLYVFTKPIYLPIHLDYIRNILAKDFQYFTDRGLYHNERDDPLSANLLTLKEDRWRNLRAKLTPAFGIGKMKSLFPKLIACSNQLVKAIDKLILDNAPVDIKDVSRCFTIDIIGSCLLSINCNCLENGNNEINMFCKMIFSPLKNLNCLIYTILQENRKVGQFLRIPGVQPIFSKLISNIVEDIVYSRKNTESTVNDFIQFLINLNEEAKKNVYEGTFSINEIVAEVYGFFVAGFELAATTLSFCLYELGLNPEIQDKLRHEINDVYKYGNNDIFYNNIIELKYLNQVVNETLRKYPPDNTLTRECVEDYHVPNTNVVITKGTKVLIPVFPLHHDPEYYPNPDKFDPDRFSSANKRLIKPFTFLPFGEGPRNCIGLNLGQMQIKIGLVALLKSFKFTVNNKTDVPLKMDPRTFVLAPKNKILLDVKKLVQE